MPSLDQLIQEHKDKYILDIFAKNKNWDYGGLSMNINLSWDIILNNLDKKWDWLRKRK